MSTELRPLGVACNIACRYCYQGPQRAAETGNQRRYDMEKMKQAVMAEGGPFTLFGGEPLMVPIGDLAELIAWGYTHWGRNNLQTNGVRITANHIALFRKYNVHVGISVDGPGVLNDARWSQSLEKTRRDTAATHENIRRLCDAGLIPSLIVTLHRGNALPEHWTAMAEWFRELDQLKIENVRLHLLEVEDEIGREYRLTPEENLAALTYFRSQEKQYRSIRFDLFAEIAALQRGEDHRVSCVWHACDPFTTAAVSGVEGDGKRTNCGRVNKEGVEFVKAGRPSYLRYIALAQTPQEDGGCQGCRFFVMCKGNCPGTAEGRDWRNRTEHCETLKALFETEEAEQLAAGNVPLSLHPVRFAVEKALIAAWTQGSHRSIHRILAATPKDRAEIT